MKTVKITIGVILALFIVTGSFAQEDNICKQKMQALKAMEGEWRGGGWIITRDRQRLEFTQKEKIQYLLNGTVLQVHGQGWDVNGELVHNALGMMSYNSKTNEYGMYSYLEDGKQTNASLEIREDGQIKWSFETPDGGTVRYLITIDDDTWTEKGEYSPDGNNWFPIIEFTLKRA